MVLFHDWAATYYERCDPMRIIKGYHAEWNKGSPALMVSDGLFSFGADLLDDKF